MSRSSRPHGTHRQRRVKTAVWVVFGLAFQLAVALGSTAAEAATKIGIIVFDGVLTSDVTAPIEVFGAASKQSWFSSYEVVTIAIDKKTITTEEGLTIVAGATIKDKLDLDALIVPSSYDMAPLLANESLIAFIKSRGTEASWVASNCSGAWLLAQSGLLDGRNATTWSGGEEKMQARYPKVKVQFDKNVVVDGKFITSNGGPVSYEGAFAMLARMTSAKNAKQISDRIQFNRIKPRLDLDSKP